MTTYWRTACGAKTRVGSPCQLPQGWGTAHPGEGRCKLHGGCAGRKPTHGGYSTRGVQPFIPPGPLLADPVQDAIFRQAIGVQLLMLNREAEGLINDSALAAGVEAYSRACFRQLKALEPSHSP